MEYLGVFFSVVLWFSTSRMFVAGSAFNPTCYLNSSAARFNATPALKLLEIETVLPEQVDTLTITTLPKPLEGCGLDLYLKGHFNILNLILDLVQLGCAAQTEGYSDPEVIKISSGSTVPPDQTVQNLYPDVPNQWWLDQAVIILLKIPQVNAYQQGHFICTARHVALTNGVTLNISISVNGCPTGYWGVDCNNECPCKNKTSCSSWDGSCGCSKFWKGQLCETENPHVEAINKSVYYGEDTTVSCIPYFLKNNLGDVRWRFNGVYLDESSNVNIMPTVTLLAITIPSIRDEDSGIYTCEVTYDGQVYTSSATINITGCLPGMFGENCSRMCNCENNGTCARFEGCQCSDPYTGRSCELMKCEGGVVREFCPQDLPPNNNNNQLGLGFGIGGGILVLLLILLLLFYFKLRRKVTVVTQSAIDADYIRSKDVSDLVKHKDKLVSDDLGVLWAHWALDESLLYVGKRLDEGSFSTVYEGHVLMQQSFYEVAIKMLKNEKDSTAYGNFIEEFEVLANVCPHRNIVQLVGLCTKTVFSQVVTCLVLEHMSLGSLYKILHSNRKPELSYVSLTPELYARIVLDILQGMAKLEEMRTQISSDAICRKPSSACMQPSDTRSYFNNKVMIGSMALCLATKNVANFFDNLESVMRRFNFEPMSIYNCDETGLITVHKPPNVIADKGTKQVGQITSAERGTLVTMLGAMNAQGNSIPPFLVFPRVHFKDYMITNAPPDTVGVAHQSGWMTASNFLLWIDHFIKHSQCSRENPVLLLMDNHESHISLGSLDKAKENGIVLLTFPPHCSHKLQPLDRTVYGPLKIYYNVACNSWMISNPGKPMTIYDVAGALGDSFPRAFCPTNITSGFKVAGIFPFDSEIFSHDEFMSSFVTDRPATEQYVHRDLASRDVLLTDNMVAKISDFGLARDTYSTGGYETKTNKSKKLPWKWMAFESLKDNIYTNKSDIWSFGVLLWEIASLGASPYPGVSNEGLLAYLEEGNRLERPTTCTKVWYSAMSRCWKKDAEDRPTFDELVPYFTTLFQIKEHQSPFLEEINIYIDVRDLDAKRTDAILEITENEDGQNEQLSVKSLINEA